MSANNAIYVRVDCTTTFVEYLSCADRIDSGVIVEVLDSDCTISALGRAIQRARTEYGPVIEHVFVDVLL